MIPFDISLLSMHRSADQQTLDETSTNSVLHVISKHLPSLKLFVQKNLPVCLFFNLAEIQIQNENKFPIFIPRKQVIFVPSFYYHYNISR